MHVQTVHAVTVRQRPAVLYMARIFFCLLRQNANSAAQTRPWRVCTQDYATLLYASGTEVAVVIFFFG